jgi:hypothetical protein
MWPFKEMFGESQKVRAASRLYGKAVCLDKKEKPYEAIVMVCRALQAAREAGANLIEPQALSLILAVTALFDELATKVGRPEIVLTALRDALELCDRAVAADSKRTELVQPYYERFSRQISFITAQQKE